MKSKISDEKVLELIDKFNDLNGDEYMFYVGGVYERDDFMQNVLKPALAKTVSYQTIKNTVEGLDDTKDYVFVDAYNHFKSLNKEEVLEKLEDYDVLDD